jgi:hypothetical protein
MDVLALAKFIPFEGMGKNSLKASLTPTLIVYHISPGMESYLPIAPRPDAALSLQGEHKVGGPL